MPKASSPPASSIAKTFGHIPGIEVGKTWKLRSGVKTDGLHMHAQGGISWSDEGAQCVVLSGAYAEDVDQGYQLVYTGSGDEKENQNFLKGGNKALKKNEETGNPVRLVRGPADSQWAPVEGYRYDGLYIVRRAFIRKSPETGLDVCMFYMERLEGQPPLVQYKSRAILKSFGNYGRRTGTSHGGSRTGFKSKKPGSPS